MHSWSALLHYSAVIVVCWHVSTCLALAARKQLYLIILVVIAAIITCLHRTCQEYPKYYDSFVQEKRNNRGLLLSHICNTLGNHNCDVCFSAIFYFSWFSYWTSRVWCQSELGINPLKFCLVLFYVFLVFYRILFSSIPSSQPSIISQDTVYSSPLPI